MTIISNFLFADERQIESKGLVHRADQTVWIREEALSCWRNCIYGRQLCDGVADVGQKSKGALEEEWIDFRHEAGGRQNAAEVPHGVVQKGLQIRVLFLGVFAFAWKSEWLWASRLVRYKGRCCLEVWRYGMLAVGVCLNGRLRGGNRDMLIGRGYSQVFYIGSFFVCLAYLLRRTTDGNAMPFQWRRGTWAVWSCCGALLVAMILNIDFRREDYYQMWDIWEDTVPFCYSPWTCSHRNSIPLYTMIDIIKCHIFEPMDDDLTTGQPPSNISNPCSSCIFSMHRSQKMYGHRPHCKTLFRIFPHLKGIAGCTSRQSFR